MQRTVMFKVQISKFLKINVKSKAVFQRLVHCLFGTGIARVICSVSVKVDSNTFDEDCKPSLNVQKLPGCGHLFVFPQVKG